MDREEDFGDRCERGGETAALMLGRRDVRRRTAAVAVLEPEGVRSRKGPCGHDECRQRLTGASAASAASPLHAGVGGPAPVRVLGWRRWCGAPNLDSRFQVRGAGTRGRDRSLEPVQ